MSKSGTILRLIGHALNYMLLSKTDRPIIDLYRQKKWNWIRLAALVYRRVRGTVEPPTKQWLSCNEYIANVGL